MGSMSPNFGTYLLVGDQPPSSPGVVSGFRNAPSFHGSSFLAALGSEIRQQGLQRLSDWTGHGKAFQTASEVVESLNRLSSGVAVPGKTPGAENRTIRCLTTDFLGDWKWHRVFGFEGVSNISAFYLPLPLYFRHQVR